MTGPKGNSEFCFPETLDVQKLNKDSWWQLTMTVVSLTMTVEA